MRALVVTAAANVVLHVAGLVLALVGMRRGSPLFPLDERLAYLASHPPLWSWGWGVWMACALALVAFLAALHPYASRPALSSLAVTLASVGMAVDLVCDVGQIVVLPDLAGWRPPQPAAFVSWERWLGATGAIVANGLYSVAVVLMSFALRARLPRSVWALGLVTAAAGTLMVVAGFTGDCRQLEMAVGPTIVSFLLWTAGVTWALARRD